MTTKTSNRGRPRNDKKPEFADKLQIFEMWLMKGETINKALQEAEIPMSSYYKHLEDHPEYLEKVEKMRDVLADSAEKKLADVLAMDDPALVAFQVELAKWILRKRRPEKYIEAPAVTQPQLPAGGQLNINLGTQQVIRMGDLTDTELEQIERGEKTAQQIFAERAEKGTNPTKS